jgi:Spy/CpxP family protein refolding chaperone
MQLLTKRLLSCAAVVVLGAVALCAKPARHGMVKQMATYFNFTPAQTSQARAIFLEAKQSALPVRKQLRETRQALKAAIPTGNADQVQQLATTQGSELGQLAAIRAEAFAKVYKTLTPEQQQKVAAFQQSRHGGKRAAGVQN